MMLLITHIVIALASVAQATYLFFAPTRAKFRAANTLVAATFASGALLIAFTPIHNLARVCVTGLVYIGAVVVLIGFAHRKLAALEKTRDHDPNFRK